MSELSRNAQVLKYFAQNYGAPGVPRKRLVKLAFMTDLLARQYLGHPISHFEYLKDHFGPNARDLPEYAQELERAELAVEFVERHPTHRTIRLRDCGRPVAFDFTAGESEILAYVVENYLSMDLDEFIDDVVKETDAFKAATRQGESLPMHLVDNSRRNEIGFDLESVLLAERQNAEGLGVTLSEFSRALRTDPSARHTN